MIDTNRLDAMLDRIDRNMQRMLDTIEILDKSSRGEITSRQAYLQLEALKSDYSAE